MKEGDGCEQRHHQHAQDDCLPRSKTKRRLRRKAMGVSSATTSVLRMIVCRVLKQRED
jgi:hypothetical protein